MADTPHPSSSPSNPDNSDYPELHRFFRRNVPLSENKQQRLTTAVRNAMDSAICGEKWPKNRLAVDIRKCVEDKKLCPPSLDRKSPKDQHTNAFLALSEALNDPKIRGIVDMVWHRAMRT